MQRSLLDAVCNVPVSGETRETKDWPPVILVEAHEGVTHLVVQGGRSCLHTNTAIWLTRRLLYRHQILGDPFGTTEGLLAQPHGDVMLLLTPICFDR